MWIREKSKIANGMLTCGNEDIPLDPFWTKSVGGDREERDKKERKERKKEKEREKLYLLSKFLSDRTIGFRRS